MLKRFVAYGGIFKVTVKTVSIRDTSNLINHKPVQSHVLWTELTSKVGF